MKKYFLITAAIFLLGGINSLQAQEKKKPENILVPLETFSIEAKVVSTLQGRNDLAVLQIIGVPKNKWDLKPKDEILTTFYFTTVAVKGEESFPGVKSGDIIRADISGKLNTNTVQVDYTVLRYQVLGSSTETSEVPPANGSRK